MDVFHYEAYFMKKKNIITDLRAMRLKDGDILLVKDTLIGDDTRAHFMEHLSNVVNKNVLVLFVNSFSELKKIDENQMRAAGWMRIPDEDS